MTDQSAIDTAVKRLALALDALDAAVERRREADRSEDALAAQVQALGADRTQARRRARRRGRALAPARSDQPRDRHAGSTPPSPRSGRWWTEEAEAMTHVNATIAGRQFRLACEDGQEEHLQALAQDLDQRIDRPAQASSARSATCG